MPEEEKEYTWSDEDAETTATINPDAVLDEEEPSVETPDDEADNNDEELDSADDDDARIDPEDTDYVDLAKLPFAERKKKEEELLRATFSGHTPINVLQRALNNQATRQALGINSVSSKTLRDFVNYMLAMRSLTGQNVNSMITPEEIEEKGLELAEWAQPYYDSEGKKFYDVAFIKNRRKLGDLNYEKGALIDEDKDIESLTKGKMEQSDVVDICQELSRVTGIGLNIETHANTFLPQRFSRIRNLTDKSRKFNKQKGVLYLDGSKMSANEILTTYISRVSTMSVNTNKKNFEVALQKDRDFLDLDPMDKEKIIKRFDSVYDALQHDLHRIASDIVASEITKTLPKLSAEERLTMSQAYLLSATQRINCLGNVANNPFIMKFIASIVTESVSQFYSSYQISASEIKQLNEELGFGAMFDSANRHRAVFGAYEMPGKNTGKELMKYSTFDNSAVVEPVVELTPEQIAENERINEAAKTYINRRVDAYNKFDGKTGDGTTKRMPIPRISKKEKEKIEAARAKEYEDHIAMLGILADYVATEEMEKERLEKEAKELEKARREEELKKSYDDHIATLGAMADYIAEEERLKEEAERLAREKEKKVLRERLDKEYADHLATLGILADNIVEEERLKEEAQRLREKEEAELKARLDKEYDDHIATLGAMADFVGEEERKKEEAKELAQLEAERIAREEAARKAKEELKNIEAQTEGTKKYLDDLKKEAEEIFKEIEETKKLWKEIQAEAELQEMQAEADRLAIEQLKQKVNEYETKLAAAEKVIRDLELEKIQKENDEIIKKANEAEFEELRKQAEKELYGADALAEQEAQRKAKEAEELAKTIEKEYDDHIATLGAMADYASEEERKREEDEREEQEQSNDNANLGVLSYNVSALLKVTEKTSRMQEVPEGMAVQKLYKGKYFSERNKDEMVTAVRKYMVKSVAKVLSENALQAKADVAVYNEVEDKDSLLKNPAYIKAKETSRCQTSIESVFNKLNVKEVETREDTKKVVDALPTSHDRIEQIEGECVSKLQSTIEVETDKAVELYIALRESENLSEENKKLVEYWGKSKSAASFMNFYANNVVSNYQYEKDGQMVTVESSIVKDTSTSKQIKFGTEMASFAKQTTRMATGTISVEVDLEHKYGFEFIRLDDGKYVQRLQKDDKDGELCHVVIQVVSKGRTDARVTKEKIYSKYDLIRTSQSDEESKAMVADFVNSELKKVQAEKQKEEV